MTLHLEDRAICGLEALVSLADPSEYGSLVAVRLLEGDDCVADDDDDDDGGDGDYDDDGDDGDYDDDDGDCCGDDGGWC